METTMNSVFDLENKGGYGKSTAIYTQDMRAKQGIIYTEINKTTTTNEQTDDTKQ